MEFSWAWALDQLISKVSPEVLLCVSRCPGLAVVPCTFMGSAPITPAGTTTSDAGPIIPWVGPLGAISRAWAPGCRQCQSQLVVSSAQICVGVGRSKDADGFIRVSSGKKRGLVPADALTEI